MDHIKVKANGRSGRIDVRAMAAVLAAALSGGSALAFEIDTGNPDLSIRWDNTIRYNLGLRVEGRDNNIGNSAVSDEGTYSFNTGSVVTNRIDILSELDVVYKKRVGFRVSGAGWYDGAYDGNSASNPNPPLVNIPSYVNRQYTPYTKRFYHGPSAELLDAFVFGNFDLGTAPTSLKAGRLSLYWGESLFLGGNLHGIAYAQNPLDLQKGFATPGSEAKELFRPLGQVTAQRAGDRYGFGRGAVLLAVGGVPLPGRRHLHRSGGLRLQRPPAAVPLGAPRVRRARQSHRARSERRVGGLRPLESRLAGWDARPLLPQLRRQAAADAAHPGRCQQPQRLQPDLQGRHRSVGDQPREERRRHQPRGRALVPRQHAAQLAAAR